QHRHPGRLAWPGTCGLRERFRLHHRAAPGCAADSHREPDRPRGRRWRRRNARRRDRVRGRGSHHRRALPGQTAWKALGGRMGRAIVITSGKGGVGKTTTTANLGTALARLGKQVVLVDADIGLRNLDVVLGLENRIVYHVVDVVQGKCTPQKALIKDRRLENLFLLPASQTDDKDSVTPDQMKDLIQTMKAAYDYVIIDCPAGIEQGFRNAVAGADEAIVVATPEVASIRDADRVVGLLAAQSIGARLIV